MSNSPRMSWPYPSESQRPWYDAFKSMVSAMDASAYASREDRQMILTEGGTVGWSAGVLSWSTSIKLTSSISGFVCNVTAGSVAVADGQCVYAVLTRRPSSNVTVTALVASQVPSSDDAIVIGIRIGTRFYFRNGAKLEDGGSATTVAPGVGGGGPPSGAAGGDLAGTYPNPTVDGLQGRPVASTAPNTDDVLTWNGSSWEPAAPTGGGGGGGSLQDAYDGGHNIATADDNAITVTGSSGSLMTLTQTGSAPEPVLELIVSSMFTGQAVALRAQVATGNPRAIIQLADGDGDKMTLWANKLAGGTSISIAPDKAETGDLAKDVNIWGGNGCDAADLDPPGSGGDVDIDSGSGGDPADFEDPPGDPGVIKIGKDNAEIIQSGRTDGATLWTHEGQMQILNGGTLTLGEDPGGTTQRGLLRIWDTTGEPVFFSEPEACRLLSINGQLHVVRGGTTTPLAITNTGGLATTSAVGFAITDGDTVVTMDPLVDGQTLVLKGRGSDGVAGTAGAVLVSGGRGYGTADGGDTYLEGGTTVAGVQGKINVGTISGREVVIGRTGVPVYFEGNLTPLESATGDFEASDFRSGSIVSCLDGATITCTLDACDAGFTLELLQDGAGQVVVYADGIVAVAVHNAAYYPRTAGTGSSLVLTYLGGGRVLVRGDLELV